MSLLGLPLHHLHTPRFRAKLLNLAVELGNLGRMLLVLVKQALVF